MHGPRAQGRINVQVSVVIPTKDRPAVLAMTLASVLAQQDVTIEVIVVDDGSTPDHAEAVRLLDPAVTVVRHESSRGVAAARNAGLASAQGEWVAFVDDDDLWAPDKLRRQLLAAADAPGARWVCSGAALFTATTGIFAVHMPPPGAVTLAALLQGNVIPGGGSGVLAQAGALLEIGGMDEDFSTLADWDCWIRLAQQSPGATVRHADVAYRVHVGSMAHDVPLAQAELARLLAKHGHLYDQHQVDFDDWRWTDYLISVAYRAGHWRTGVRLSARQVRRNGQVSAVAQPLVALLPLRARKRFRASRLALLDQGPLREAVAWLTALESGPTRLDPPALESQET